MDNRGTFESDLGFGKRALGSDIAMTLLLVNETKCPQTFPSIKSLQSFSGLEKFALFDWISTCHHF